MENITFLFFVGMFSSIDFQSIFRREYHSLLQSVTEDEFLAEILEQILSREKGSVDASFSLTHVMNHPHVQCRRTVSTIQSVRYSVGLSHRR
jgi:hypothetical protein